MYLHKTVCQNFLTSCDEQFENQTSVKLSD